MRIILVLLVVLNFAMAKKVALVIGNSNYITEGYLPNPINDAKLIAKKLRNVGFEVTLKRDIKSADKMKSVINGFLKKLKKDDIAVVYYAGHGVQCRGKNYLIPTKANIVRGGQLQSEALNLDFLIGGLSDIKLAVVMLDACRDNSYPSCGRGKNRGLARPSIPNNGGMIISFATGENEIADDGNGEHSPYALAISKYLEQNIPIETFFRKVGSEVFTTSNQRPMFQSSFYGDFSFGKREECTKTITIPAKYKTVTKRVLVKEESVEKSVVVPLFKTITERLLYKPFYYKYLYKKDINEDLPFDTTFESFSTDGGSWVSFKPKLIAKTKRIIIREPFTKLIVANGIVKKIKVPTKYKTVIYYQVDRENEREILEFLKDKSYKKISIPAKYKTIIKKILVKPSKIKTIKTPAVYKTVTEKILVSPKTKKSISVPCDQ